MQEHRGEHAEVAARGHDRRAERESEEVHRHLSREARQVPDLGAEQCSGVIIEVVAAASLPAEITAITNTATFAPMSTLVTVPAAPARAPPPNEERAWRIVRRPSATQSGHWNPTGASMRQSAQIGLSQRTQRQIGLAIPVAIADRGRLLFAHLGVVISR